VVGDVIIDGVLATQSVAPPTLPIADTDTTGLLSASDWQRFNTVATLGETITCQQIIVDDTAFVSRLQSTGSNLPIQSDVSVDGNIAAEGTVSTRYLSSETGANIKGLVNVPDFLDAPVVMTGIVQKTDSASALVIEGPTFHTGQFVIDGSCVCIGNLLTNSRVGININAPTPQAALHVGGDIYLTGELRNTSDRRVKTDLRQIDDALNILKNIEPYTFSFLKDPDVTKSKLTPNRYAGCMAQDLVKHFPEVVSRTPDDMLTVAYGSLVPLLIGAVNQLARRLDDIENC
jgi:hypothetical protein